MNTQPLSTKDPVEVTKFGRLAELWRYVYLLGASYWRMMTDYWFDLPSFVLRLADKGAEAAMWLDPDLLHGLNVYQGKVTNL